MHWSCASGRRFTVTDWPLLPTHPQHSLRRRDTWKRMDWTCRTSYLESCQKRTSGRNTEATWRDRREKGKRMDTPLSFWCMNVEIIQYSGFYESVMVFLWSSIPCQYKSNKKKYDFFLWFTQWSLCKISCSLYKCCPVVPLGTYILIVKKQSVCFNCWMTESIFIW